MSVETSKWTLGIGVVGIFKVAKKDLMEGMRSGVEVLGVQRGIEVSDGSTHLKNSF
ncbi:unnamed protein product [marine sediment metagenome]|uniref:Uncharacterized protein n=1 Tax=marine sediment metagenome TaxID=412755 RepID=X1TPS3_9ZZZZ